MHSNLSAVHLKDVAPEAPTEWTVVTRDLYKDFGALHVNGISLRILGQGEALFDHVYLGRTIEDLDKLSVK